MRAKKMNKTVLVEEQATPDRRGKTMPSKLQPPANLR